MEALLAAAQGAQAEGQLRAAIDPEQLVFEVLAFQGAANVAAGQQNAGDGEKARQAVAALLERARA